MESAIFSGVENCCRKPPSDKRRAALLEAGIHLDDGDGAFEALLPQVMGGGGPDDGATHDNNIKTAHKWEHARNAAKAQAPEQHAASDQSRLHMLHCKS